MFGYFIDLKKYLLSCIDSLTNTDHITNTIDINLTKAIG